METVLYSPPTATFITRQSASIESSDSSTNQHPVTLTETALPLPFHGHPSTKRKVFEKLKVSEQEKYVAAPQLLSDWCRNVLPCLSKAPLATVKHLKDQVIAELTGFYHGATGIQGSAKTRDAKKLG